MDTWLYVHFVSLLVLAKHLIYESNIQTYIIPHFKIYQVKNNPFYLSTGHGSFRSYTRGKCIIGSWAVATPRHDDY